MASVKQMSWSREALQGFSYLGVGRIKRQSEAILEIDPKMTRGPKLQSILVFDWSLALNYPMRASIVCTCRNPALGVQGK